MIFAAEEVFKCFSGEAIIGAHNSVTFISSETLGQFSNCFHKVREIIFDVKV